MKIYRLKLSLCLLAVCTLLSCSKENKPADPYKGLEKITYETTDEIFANPERGFFSHLEIFSDSPQVISVARYEAERLQNRSMIYLIFYMPDYMYTDIPQDYLNTVKDNFARLREVGFKAVIRFAYQRQYERKWDEAEEKPWDTSEAMVFRHIDQLAPILQEYSDVIFCMEAGFIGVFGEWYYTDNFVYQPKTVEDYGPRRRLLDKLLSVMPEDRQILVRYPAAKMLMYELEQADSLTVATAHDGSALSRIGHHNDCFVSSVNDVGTYQADGEREYVYNETRYTIWGGETCNKTPEGTCENSRKEVENHHMTYLNNSYHGNVLARWRQDGCYEEFDRRMGYRLELQEAFFDTAATAGSDYRVVLKIYNDGYAAPMNPRGVELILVSSQGEKQVIPLKDADPRFWFDGNTSVVDTEITLPSEPGTYTLYLNLPDGRENLHDDPRYSIRLANKGVWDEATGYNKIREITLK